MPKIRIISYLTIIEEGEVTASELETLQKDKHLIAKELVEDVNKTYGLGDADTTIDIKIDVID